ncbi:MAG: hypothetical protein AB7O97_11420 [Planctomycetota bacterium]
MKALETLALAADGRDLVARAPADARWCTALRRMLVAGDRELTTGDEETCALLLDGTFDLVGGTTAWPSRGARPDPTAGRPVAVFLPPRCAFAARNGQGRILLLAARQPAGDAATGRAALQQSPLLPLAGSGKSFDPGSGEWRPAETFPTAAESLPPRRIQRLSVGAVAVERVFGADYKAATLCVDELVLPVGSELAAGALALPAAASEAMLYVLGDGALRVRVGGDEVAVTGEAALFCRTPRALALRSADAPVYVAVAWAGKSTPA